MSPDPIYPQRSGETSSEPEKREEEVIHTEPIYDPNSTPPTGPMEPMSPEEIERHETGINVPIVDPGVMPGSPPVAY